MSGGEVMQLEFDCFDIDPIDTFCSAALSQKVKILEGDRKNLQLAKKVTISKKSTIFVVFS